MMSKYKTEGQVENDSRLASGRARPNPQSGAKPINTAQRFSSLRTSTFAALLLVGVVIAASITPGAAAPILIDTSMGTINGEPEGTLNGTPFRSGGVVDQVCQFFFAGELNILAEDVVMGTGTFGVSLIAGNNVNIAEGARFDFSAYGLNSGPGGGLGGDGGFLPNGGHVGKGGEGGIVAKGGAGGSPGSKTRFANAGGPGSFGQVGGTGHIGDPGASGDGGQSGDAGRSGGNSAAPSAKGGEGSQLGGARGESGGRGPLGLHGYGGLPGAGGLGQVLPGYGGLGGFGGLKGNAGAAGGSGGNGSLGNGGGGGSNTTTGELISGGNGGAGGGQGSGGGGGAGGGGAGGGGAGGGGGGGAGFSVGPGGNGGRGGKGGDGGRGENGTTGGKGGDGGAGGAGGGGGGALEIVARGRMLVDGTFAARGGDGGQGSLGKGGSPDTWPSQPLDWMGMDGSRGDKALGIDGGGGGRGGTGGFAFGNGNFGLPGSASIHWLWLDFFPIPLPLGYGGGGAGGAGGGDSGDIGIGGHGGGGGDGGGGGGGAGGTVKLKGSFVNAGGASIEAQGGVGAPGSGGASDGLGGGDGRFLYSSNIYGSLPSSILGAEIEIFDGTRDANPYIKGAPETPFIPDLLGGAEVFGLLDGLGANDPFFADVVSAAPPDTIGALARRDFGPLGYDFDFGRDPSDQTDGFDLLFLLNLTNSPLAEPKLGIDPAGTDINFLVSLMTAGLLTDPLFNPSANGPELLRELSAFNVFALLIPEGGTIFNVQAGGQTILSGRELGVGQTVFISGGTRPVPEPTSLALVGIGLVGLAFVRRCKNQD